MRLIIATKNEGKLREVKKIIGKLNIPVVSVESLKEKISIRENGKTFLENAKKKALAVSARYVDDLVVSDDSGLCVDFLHGAPGVLSKRFSGRNATDAGNNTKLLRKLKNAAGRKRKAQYYCAVALAKNKRIIKTFNGRLNGFISSVPKGIKGFGYDPVFYLPELRKTAAQIPLKEKNSISHRFKAFKKLKSYLIKHENI
ncbi:MAG: RdgB/HAM1 family non-canonical purine NTP pyrophosphatase [Candidatus Omnitrophota bacterium]